MIDASVVCMRNKIWLPRTDTIAPHADGSCPRLKECGAYTGSPASHALKAKSRMCRG